MEFLNMSDLIPATDPPKEGGMWIRHWAVTKDTAARLAPRERELTAENAKYLGLSTGTYCILNERLIDGTDRTWMSDLPFERTTNMHVLRDAYGSVLLLGLGIGMLPAALLQNLAVHQITVVEIDRRVIDLVAPHIHDDRLRIVLGDAYSPPIPALHQYDYVYFDIWPTVSASNWPTYERLLKFYANGYLRPGGRISAWCERQVKSSFIERLGNSWSNA